MRTYRRSSGQSLVEFALLLPLLLVLVMGIFEIGRAVFYYAVLSTAVREGTRYAIVQPDCDYKLTPASCSGAYRDSYPLDCKNALSAANIRICAKVQDTYFNVGELIRGSTVTIDHKLSSANDPVINIGIEFPFRPITPGLALIGEIPIEVNSQMMMTAIAKP